MAVQLLRIVVAPILDYRVSVSLGRLLTVSRAIETVQRVYSAEREPSQSRCAACISSMKACASGET